MRIAVTVLGRPLIEWQWSLCSHDTSAGDDEDDDDVRAFGFGSPNATLLDRADAYTETTWDQGDDSARRRRARGS